MNKKYKLKKAQRDFTENDLPSNRKEVFFDIFKNRFRYLIRCGLFLFLTAIPFLIICLFKTYSLAGILSDYTANMMSQTEYETAIQTYSFIFDLLIVLSSFILSIGISGMSRVIRQLAYLEPLFFGKDFGDGIKMNYKQICVHVMLLTIIYMLSDISSKANMNVVVMNYIPMVIFLFIIIPLFLYCLSQTNVYIMPVFKAIKNSMLLLFKSVPVCVLFCLVIFGFTFLNYIPNFNISVIIYVLVIVFIVPMYYLAWFLYSSYVFDKHINKQYYPEIVDKGIVRKENKN